MVNIRRPWGLEQKERVKLPTMLVVPVSRITRPSQDCNEDDEDDEDWGDSEFDHSSDEEGREDPKMAPTTKGMKYQNCDVGFAILPR